MREFYPPWNRWFDNRDLPVAGRDLDLLRRRDRAGGGAAGAALDERAAAGAGGAAGRDPRGGAPRDRARDPRPDRPGADRAQAGRGLVARPAHRAGAARRRRRARPGDGRAGRSDDRDRAARVGDAAARRSSTTSGWPPRSAWQARDFEQRTGVACELDLPPDGPAVAPAIALSLFRIVQEALTNVTRHAQAHHVHIGLTVDPQTRGPDRRRRRPRGHRRGAGAADLARDRRHPRAGAGGRRRGHDHRDRRGAERR